jgi:hypothetical protein
MGALTSKTETPAATGPSGTNGQGIAAPAPNVKRIAGPNGQPPIPTLATGSGVTQGGKSKRRRKKRRKSVRRP